MFQFKQFTIQQDRCAMKVGTDGTLLGAWARGGKRILDVGTGTGLIALMMAQRYPQAQVTGIDIDHDACSQAQENVLASPFSERIRVVECSLQLFPECENRSFDAIVSNLPFFSRSLPCPDPKRNMARHAETLPYADFFRHAARLIGDGGECSLIVPFDVRAEIDKEAALAGFMPSRVCAVITSKRKPPKRYLLAYVRQPVHDVEETVLDMQSDEYRRLVGDFYLK